MLKGGLEHAPLANNISLLTKFARGNLWHDFQPSYSNTKKPKSILWNPKYLKIKQQTFGVLQSSPLKMNFVLEVPKAGNSIERNWINSYLDNLGHD